MFRKQLDEDRRVELLKIVYFLCIFDAPILFDGVSFEDVESDTDLSKISLNVSDRMRSIFECAYDIYGDSSYSDAFEGFGRMNVGIGFLNKIREIKFINQNDVGFRLDASKEFLLDSILGKIIYKLSKFKPKEDIVQSKEEGGILSPEDQILKTGLVAGLGLMGILLRSVSDGSSRSDLTEGDALRQSRVVLFEVIRLMAGADDLNKHREEMIRIISNVYGIDEESFSEIEGQALRLNKEIKRSFSLVLE